MKQRSLVRVGSYKIGDKILENTIITGLGKPFNKYVPDEDACCWGLPPGRDYNLQVQYVYYEEIQKKGEATC